MKIYSMTLFMTILLAVGLVFFQIFLSKKKTEWFGLILPMISFLYSLLMILNIVVSKGMSTWDIVLSIISSFIIGNIPTIILLGIYFASREKTKRDSELEKMNIKDLN